MLVEIHDHLNADVRKHFGLGEFIEIVVILAVEGPDQRNLPFVRETDRFLTRDKRAVRMDDIQLDLLHAHVVVHIETRNAGMILLLRGDADTDKLQKLEGESPKVADIRHGGYHVAFLILFT